MNPGLSSLAVGIECAVSVDLVWKRTACSAWFHNDFGIMEAGEDWVALDLVVLVKPVSLHG